LGGQAFSLGRVTQQDPETTVSLTQLFGLGFKQESTGKQVPQVVSQTPQHAAPQVWVLSLQSLASTSSGEVWARSTLSKRRNW
jgi:hypothetical protein